MKKYYLNNGKEQTGPFDVNELKTKNITKTTSIWYEGLSDWTTADKIDELKVLFPTPTPPPINKTTSQTPTSSPTKRKKSYTSLIVTIVILLLLASIGLIIVNNNPNAVPGIKLEINTPKPTIVTSRADGKKSGLLKARTSVYATVMNQGGDGNVLVTFHVYQNGNHYKRTTSFYLRSNQSQDLEETFDEVKYLGGDISYNVEAIAQ